MLASLENLHHGIKMIPEACLLLFIFLANGLNIDRAQLNC